MEIIYRAKDGKEFDNEEDCVYHERLTEIEMYDQQGHPTTDVDFAMVVHLKDDIQTAMFIELNREHNIEPEGIDKYDTGWFYWDEDHYQWIDISMIKAFRNLPLKEDN